MRVAMKKISTASTAIIFAIIFMLLATSLLSAQETITALRHKTSGGTTPTPQPVIVTAVVVIPTGAPVLVK